MDEPGLATALPENQTQPFVAEFTKAQLDTLIGAMDAIEQVCVVQIRSRSC